MTKSGTSHRIGERYVTMRRMATIPAVAARRRVLAPSKTGELLGEPVAHRLDGLGQLVDRQCRVQRYGEEDGFAVLRRYGARRPARAGASGRARAACAGAAGTRGTTGGGGRHTELGGELGTHLGEGSHLRRGDDGATLGDDDDRGVDLGARQLRGEGLGADRLDGVGQRALTRIGLGGREGAAEEDSGEHDEGQGGDPGPPPAGHCVGERTV